MVEGSAAEVREDQFCEAVMLGFQEVCVCVCMYVCVYVCTYVCFLSPQGKRIVNTLVELEGHRKRPVRDASLVLPPNDVREMMERSVGF